jgi:hypothetical protein
MGVTKPVNIVRLVYRAVISTTDGSTRSIHGVLPNTARRKEVLHVCAESTASVVASTTPVSLMAHHFFRAGKGEARVLVPVEKFGGHMLLMFGVAGSCCTWGFSTVFIFPATARVPLTVRRTALATLLARRSLRLPSNVVSVCAAISKVAPVFVARLSLSLTIWIVFNLKRSQAHAGTLLLLEAWKCASTADVQMEKYHGKRNEAGLCKHG